MSSSQTADTGRPKEAPAPSRIEIRDLRMSYGDTEVLRGLDLEIEPGEFVAVTGPSGCGKSTLLNLLGALDRPTGGSLVVDGIALEEMSEKAHVHYRREKVGFVFQFFNLLPTLDLTDNVALPLRLQGTSRAEAREEALTLLSAVGLEDRAEVFPATLSGGEMQRTAIARSLVHGPGLLLADEPTGNLDIENAELVLDLFRKVLEKRSATLVMVTHSAEVADQADREIRLRNGTLEQS